MLIALLACTGNNQKTTETDTYIETLDTSDSSTETETEEVTTYQVSVENGFGSGIYEEGETVHVFADFMPGNEVVTNWSGDLSLSPEWHHQFVMPANDVTITANVEETDFELNQVQYPGVQGDIQLLYAVPTNPVGVLFLFHGTGGSANVVYTTPFQNIAATAYEQGLAIVSTEAHERTTNDGGDDGAIRWNVAPNITNNIDLQNIQSISQNISTITSVPADGLRLAVGVSNGGAFAITVGAALSFDAVTSLCGVGREMVFVQTQTPTQWFMCGNDTNATVSGQRDEWENGTNSLQERGVRTDYGVFPPSPMYSERFMRIGATQEESQAAVDELRANEVLDENNFLLLSPKDIEALISSQPEDWPVFLSLIEEFGAKKVKTELKHVYADHGAFDDWTHRMLDFWRE